MSIIIRHMLFSNVLPHLRIPRTKQADSRPSRLTSKATLRPFAREIVTSLIILSTLLHSKPGQLRPDYPPGPRFSQGKGIAGVSHPRNEHNFSQPSVANMENSRNLSRGLSAKNRLTRRSYSW